MSSFGTQKVPTTNLNVGFPDPYAYWYAGTRRPEQFMPEKQLTGMNVAYGDDLQARYHNQKMRDAVYMANAKVIATQKANARAFSSPNGYYMLPPPVLGQRRFANPSMGYLDTTSTRQDQPNNGAPFHEVAGNPYASVFGRGHGYCAVEEKMKQHHLTGGVLRTTVGQDWAKAKLNERIRQLDAINEAEQIFSMGDLASIPTKLPPAGATDLTSEVAALPQIELAQRLQSILDALQSPGSDYDAISRFVVADAQKVLGLIIRLATSNDADDITDALEYIEGNSSQDGISQYTANLMATIEQSGIDEEGNPVDANIVKILSSLKELFDRIELYLKQMLKLADAPTRDRLAASKNLVKSLGFTKLTKTQQQLQAQVGNANRDTLSYPTINPTTGRPPQFSGAFIEGRSSETNPEFEIRDPFFPGSYKGVSKSNRLPHRVPVSEQDRWDILRYQTGWAEESEDARGNPRLYRFTEEAPIREDSQHGYVGTGGAQFSMDYKGAFGDGSGRFLNAVEAPSDEGQYNTGGRPIGYFEGDELAEEGQDEEGGDAVVALEPGPNIRSRRDPLTGEYDVAPPSNANPYINIEEVGQQAPRESAPTRKTYTSADVPTSRDALIRFITSLPAKHPGYNQTVYRTASKTSNIRRNTLKKLAAFGLL